MRLGPAFRNRYANISRGSIILAQFGSTFVCASYWVAAEEMGVLLTALAVATSSTAGLLIGLEWARWLLLAWPSAPGKT